MLRARGMLRPGQKVFVACSGGPDSVALFHLLAFLAARWRLTLGLLHVNHRLRGRESDRDERFVRALAERFGVPFWAGSREIRNYARRHRASLEEAAREVRYACLVHLAKRHRIPRIALAHTLDDQAETVFLRMIQGTGLRGLCGIRPELRREGVVFVRPLLDFSKKEVLDFLRAGGIRYRRDASNRSLGMMRNRIRIKVLPRLTREFNPRLVEALARIPAIVSGENALLEDLEKRAWGRVFRGLHRKSLRLDRLVFGGLPAPLQFRILERALKRLDARGGLNYDAWGRLEPHLREKRYRCSLPRDLDIDLSTSWIKVYKKSQKP